MDFYKFSLPITGTETANILSKDIHVFPNPTDKTVTIDYSDKINSSTVFDICGKQVFKNEQNSKELDLSFLQPGIYFLHMNINNNTVVKKILKQ